MNTDDKVELLTEILDYIDEFQQYSYYELRAYMVEYRPDWEPAFTDRNMRSQISAYLSSACKEEGIKRKPVQESLHILVEANERVRKKQNSQLEE